MYIERGSPWENGYVEFFNGKMRDELLNREQIDTLRDPVLSHIPLHLFRVQCLLELLVCDFRVIVK